MSQQKKCKKCKQNEATSDEGLCDDCRFAVVLNDMWVESKLQQKHA